MEQKIGGARRGDLLEGSELLSYLKDGITALSYLERIKALDILYSIRDMFEEGGTREDEGLSAKVVELKTLIGLPHNHAFIKR